MAKYTCAPIAALAAQLRRGPVRLRLRQLAGIEFLLSVVEPAKKYPLDFVTHALTGFRARGGEAEKSALLDSNDLRLDLLELAEDLSGSVDIWPETFSEPIFSINDLAARFRVSTKTIFRWHYRGLVGWRLRVPNGRPKLVFPDHCVRRFVAANSDLIQRGSSFSQLSPDERQTIIDRARALVDGGEKTVNSVARVIAAETDRAVETIRLILKAYDDAHPKAGIFNRSPLAVDADDVRLKVWDAYKDGATVPQLASRFERPAAWVYRVITEMRARERKCEAIEYIPSAEFDLPDAESIILDCPAARSPLGETLPARRIPTDLPPYLQHLFRIPLLTPEGEAALFRKMNYLRCRADQLRQKLDPPAATAAELDRIDSLIADAEQVKNQIVQSNLRLVVSIAKKHVPPMGEFFEMVSDGNMSLMRAVDKFDYSRGFKFSTYASWAIMKNFARTVPDERVRRDRYQTGREEFLETAVGAVPDEHENDFLPVVRSTVEKMLASLSDRERDIIRLRFGLDGAGEPATLEQIGQQLGVSKERIRQLEARAMGKLRTDFEPQMNSLLSA
ncbi:MAG: sigma-70 family RNA polymerase sigma factor [Phycisphaerales bacterium]|nr:sigma-70 family RNA polymerase sigma factor [Phycisphaerales bacterium]